MAHAEDVTGGSGDGPRRHAPDMRFEIKQGFAADDRAIVRGEVSGTLASGPFGGVIPHSG